MGRFVAMGAIAIVFATSAEVSPAFAADDDLALDLGTAADKPGDAGAGLRKLELHRIAKGTFIEGSPASDSYREPDEVQRNVTITKPFWMGKYPVTRAQFARFVSETRFQTDAEKGQSGGFGWDGIRLKQAKEYTWRNPGFTQTEDDPVTLVTFGDANAFTAWASRKTGRRVRLPTEAEYEYAARGGTTTPWYAAKTEEEAAQVVGWFRPPPGAAVGTHPVGRKKANPFGLFDMSGNVNEWTLDVYAPWTNADATDPANTANASTTEPERRVLRGGSWMRDPRKGRSAARYRNTPGTRNADNGFRVVVEDEVVAPPPTTAATAPSPAPSSSVAQLAPAPSEIPSAMAPLQIAPPVVQRQSTEGVGWGFFAAPFGAMGFVVAWMLARRKKLDDATPVSRLHREAAAKAVTPTPAKVEVYRPTAATLPPLAPPPAQIHPRSPWPSDQMKAAPAIPSSERSLASGPPAPLPMSERSLASGPPAPLPMSERSLASGPPAPLPMSERSASSRVPPPVVSGPPAPLSSERAAPSRVPPAAPPSDLPGPRSEPPGPRSSAQMMIAPPVASFAATPPPPLTPSAPPVASFAATPPPPLAGERGLPSGPPAPLSSARMLPSAPPPIVSGPPAPLPMSERGLPSGPPAPLSSARMLPSVPPALPSGSQLAVARSVPPALPSGPPPPGSRMPPALPSSERMLPSGPPPPVSRMPPALPSSERMLPSGPPPPPVPSGRLPPASPSGPPPPPVSSGRLPPALPSGPPPPMSSSRLPPALPSGAPSRVPPPLPASERALASRPPAPNEPITPRPEPEPITMPIATPSGPPPPPSSKPQSR